MPEFSAGAAPHRPIVLAVFLLLIAAEAAWLAWRGRAGYDWRETLASTVIAAGNMLIRPLNLLLLAPLFALVYAHRLFDLRLQGLPSFVALMIGVDFVYYWFHRASHRLRWMWATHAVHHSSTRLNLSAAYRLGWTELFSGAWLFLLVPVWLGVSPPLVAGAFALNLVYQFILHSSVIGRLGWLEWVFNTPAHHRVHHAVNAELLDRNFGGILIVWDRLFGTFAEAPAEELRYGVLGRAPAYRPLVLVGREWWAMFADWRAARGWRARLRTLV
ncbi:sterol desaturase family protein [Solimonas soli]|uniref:sterol desaturase family protein n=1 Tax=Solimonas soli TaxID=413479 RepID=UPI00048747B9|nr:sterol desaturase family protein [Solimonas soli]